MTAPRHEFGTSGWFTLMQTTIVDKLIEFRARASAERIAQASFSMAEIALDPPFRIGHGAARIGWRCRVEAGRLAEFEVDQLDGAAHTLFAPYDLLRRLACFDTTGREQEYASLVHAAFSSGQLRVEGSSPRAPRELNEIHNIMARSTL